LSPRKQQYLEFPLTPSELLQRTRLPPPPPPHNTADFVNIHFQFSAGAAEGKTDDKKDSSNSKEGNRVVLAVPEDPSGNKEHNDDDADDEDPERTKPQMPRKCLKKFEKSVKELNDQSQTISFAKEHASVTVNVLRYWAKLLSCEEDIPYVHAAGDVSLPKGLAKNPKNFAYSFREVFLQSVALENIITQYLRTAPLLTSNQETDVPLQVIGELLTHSLLGLDAKKPIVDQWISFLSDLHTDEITKWGNFDISPSIAAVVGIFKKMPVELCTHFRVDEVPPTLSRSPSHSLSPHHSLSLK